MAKGIIQRRRRTCITNYIEQIVPMYTDEEFIMHYRLNDKERFSEAWWTDLDIGHILEI